MSRVSGAFKSSVNAGQLSSSLYGKVSLKQYYSGAKVMAGFEPIPQSGFSLLPGSAYIGPVASGTCAKGVLNVSATLSYTLIFTAGSVDIWRNDRVKVATVALAVITADMLPELRFFGEANTVGIFHPSLWNGIRLLRDAANDALWTVDVWPYANIPELDLGGTYAKTSDVWQLYVRWADEVESYSVSISIDGTVSGAVTLSNGGVAVDPDAASDADWTAFAVALQTEARSLPGMSTGLTVARNTAEDGTRYRVFTITFGGDLQGDEYDVIVSVLNTASASALVSHQTIGETEGEPLISASRDGFAGMAMFQDRAIYYAPAARGAAMAFSQPGEYFNLNIKSQATNAPRLEALRSETSEQIYHVIDAAYLVAFTDQAEYFASNRTIKLNEPMNWVRSSSIGSKRSCPPVLLEGSVYFVSADGGRLYRNNYDAVGETFQPKPVNDLNGSESDDLVRDIRAMAVQRKRGAMASDRLWILREDGRLVCGIVNVGQDIELAACEWVVAGGGSVKAIAVDGQENVWLTVDRGGVVTEEMLEEEGEQLFQKAVSVVTDLTGQASGLAVLNGRTVWAEIDNDVFGPFTVSAGAIETGQAGKTAKIGLWQAPVYESMPFVRVLQNDDVVRRPGKVVAVRLYVKDTASLAVGANGRAAKDVSLSRMSDDLDAAKVNFTGHVPVAGLIGACMDPTVTISQVRPGRIRVRDYVPGVKL
ncbi:MAG: hypothetical protein DI589_06585 [Shinella sp.]|nr:MAG: hypothetical protein DI589_06585 [Shinella sp.]